MKTRLLVVIATAASLLTIAAPAHAASSYRTSPCRNGYVSISYDDGPTPTTPDLLRALRRASITATFFDMGKQAELYPRYVNQEISDGHEVANHSYSHPNFQDIGDDAALAELSKTQTILRRGFDKPTFYRPPYGATDDTIASRAKTELGLTEIIWTVDTNDWDGRSTDDIVAALANVKDGDFVLMHDGYANTIAAVPRIADLLKSKGLCDGKIVRSKTPVQAWENLSFYADVTAW